MIDSHCHLTRLTRVPGDPDPIASLAAVISVGTSVEDARATIEIAERDPRVFAAVGIHPNSASDARSAAAREAIERLATHRRVVAIGETGFDDHWQDETLATQLAAFEWHADLAQRLGKPLVLHVRDRQGGSAASHAAASAILAAGHGMGVLHCFNGDATLYEAALQLDWYVSFAGNLTYKSAAPIREVAAVVPLDRLLVETDSPYLAPLPQRGNANVPENVRLTAARLAEVRGIDEAELELTLDANARRLFRLELTE
jgi:TatD DNase family protein